MSPPFDTSSGAQISVQFTVLAANFFTALKKKRKEKKGSAGDITNVTYVL